MQIITIINHKGGVCKSTSVVNLACSLVSKGFTVGLLDLEAQASISSMLLSDEELEKCTDITSIVKSTKTIARYIQKSDFRDLGNNLWILPNHHDLTDGLFFNIFPNENQDKDRELIIPKLLSKLEAFDYLLIDTPPNMEQRAKNAILASNFLIIPTMLENESVKNIKNVLAIIEGLKNKYSEFDSKIGIIYTKVDRISTFLNKIFGQVAEKLELPILGKVYKNSAYAYAVNEPAYYTSASVRADHDEITKNLVLCLNQN